MNSNDVKVLNKKSLDLFKKIGVTPITDPLYIALLVEYDKVEQNYLQAKNQERIRKFSVTEWFKCFKTNDIYYNTDAYEKMMLKLVFYRFPDLKKKYDDLIRDYNRGNIFFVIVPENNEEEEQLESKERMLWRNAKTYSEYLSQKTTKEIGNLFNKMIETQEKEEEKNIFVEASITQEVRKTLQFSDEKFIQSEGAVFLLGYNPALLSYSYIIEKIKHHPIEKRCCQEYYDLISQGIKNKELYEQFTLSELIDWHNLKSPIDRKQGSGRDKNLTHPEFEKIIFDLEKEFPNFFEKFSTQKEQAEKIEDKIKDLYLSDQKKRISGSTIKKRLKERKPQIEQLEFLIKYKEENDTEWASFSLAKKEMSLDTELNHQYKNKGEYAYLLCRETIACYLNKFYKNQ